jgi:hypothetical protein
VAKRGRGAATEQNTVKGRDRSGDPIDRESTACTGSFQCARMELYILGKERGADWGGAKTQQKIGRCILRTACCESPMHGMKLDIIDGEHQGLIFPAWYLVFPMAPKRIILPENGGSSEKSEE